VVTSGDNNAGGSNVFEFWSEGDQQLNQAGALKTLHDKFGGTSGFLELNDASGSNAQTLGIQKTLDTVAGATYFIQFDYAGEMGYAASQGVVALYVDGVQAGTASGTSAQAGLTWRNKQLSFVATGGPQVIKLVSQASSYTADGRGVFIDNLQLSEYTPNTAPVNTTITLQQVYATLVDTDGSEIRSLTVSGIPPGATLKDSTDATKSFTATAGNQSLDISTWNAACLTITPAANYFGVFDLTFTGTATESFYTSSTASISKTMTVRVLAAPTVTPATISAVEDTPYTFQWSDFGGADSDSPELWVEFAGGPSRGSIEYFHNGAWGSVWYGSISRSEIQSGKLRFVPWENESGYAGYAVAGTGNQMQHYATLQYLITDRQQDSATVQMTLDVIPVADAPLNRVSGGGSGTPLTLFTTDFESVANTDTNATVLSSSTLEGWSLVTASNDVGVGGVNAFEVWSDGDQALNKNGTLVTLHSEGPAATNHNWMSLTDATGTGIQTLGIERTINTLDGAVYTLSIDVAGDPGFPLAVAGFKILVDGVIVLDSGSTSSNSALNWQNFCVEFTGNGGPRTVQLLACASQFYPDGRGVMVDNIEMIEQMPNVGDENSDIRLQTMDVFAADADGSETLQQFLDDIPVGATLTDGTRTFTATAGNTSVDIWPWDTYLLKIRPPVDFVGQFTLNMRGIATETASGATAVTNTPVKVTVLYVNRPPVAVSSTILGSEDTPYVFNWSDFHITDIDSSALTVVIDTLPNCGYLQYFSGGAWHDLTAGSQYSKAFIDAGSLRFLPEADESGYPGYSVDSLGNLTNHYAEFCYHGFDGEDDTGEVVMTVDVLPVADTPNITLSGAGQGNPLTLFTTGWETVANPDANATIVNQSTLEGWTLVTSGDAQSGGTNVFEVWGHNDSQTNASGVVKQMQRAAGGGNSWLELNDASGTNSQTLGIQRTINTTAGAVYTLSLKYAAEMGFGSEYGTLGFYVDGALVDTFNGLSPGSSLTWQSVYFEWTGSGAPQTIKLATLPTLFAPEGRGAMIDMLTLTEQIPNTGPKNTAIQLQRPDVFSSDIDGSEVGHLTVSGIPAGATLADATHSFTANATNGSVDISAWNWNSLSLTPPTNFIGTLDLMLTGSVIEAGNGSSANAAAARTLRVTVLDQVCPIVLDLDGNGIQTVSLGEADGSFDLLNTGVPVRSGWISSGDAFLAVDLNHNGLIDSRHELFGGQRGEGFAALAEFDSNGDGVVDKRDAHFKDLLLWQDKNGNHHTDKGELTQLSKRVKALSTSYTEREEVQNGNLLGERGSATLSNGRTIEMSDVYFTVAPASEPSKPAFAPEWVDAQDRAARITVQSMLRIRDFQKAEVDPQLGDMVQALAGVGLPADGRKAVPAAPAMKTAQDVTRNRGEGATQEDIAINWGMRHANAGAPTRIEAIPQEGGWLGDFLGVTKRKPKDLSKATGLKIRLPHR
jgi:hypothetical protein